MLCLSVILTHSFTSKRSTGLFYELFNLNSATRCFLGCVFGIIVTVSRFFIFSFLVEGSTLFLTDHLILICPGKGQDSFTAYLLLVEVSSRLILESKMANGNSCYMDYLQAFYVVGQKHSDAGD